MNQVNLSLRRGFTINILPWRARIWFLIKILKEGAEVALLMRYLSVLHVERNTRESVLLAWMVVLDVVIKVIR